MDCLRITGGKPLHGTVRISGSKNASLPILAASILAGDTVRLLGIPELDDVATLRWVLNELGVASHRLPNGELVINTFDPTRCRADERFVGRMRASFCVLGPLLARRGKGVVALPGGCNLGIRPVDLHLRALERMGADLRISHGYVIATAKRLRGTTIEMSGPHGTSVTGTANAVCAATLACGVTTINGAAQEPEIEDLGRFLQSMGATIEGVGTPRIRVQGQSNLGGATHQVIADRIEAGTFLLATMIAGGSVRVEGLRTEHLTSLLETLDAAGAELTIERDCVTIAAFQPPCPLRLSATPYPGMPTDLQALWMAVLSTATGQSVLTDTVFPQRFGHVAELTRLGAKIAHHGSSATISGTQHLSGARVHAPDLRAAAALVLAGLAARGITTVTGLEHLDRGYERFDEKLRALGANITRVEEVEPHRPIMFRDKPSGTTRFSSM